MDKLEELIDELIEFVETAADSKSVSDEREVQRAKYRIMDHFDDELGNLWETVDLVDGAEVVYVGVHALRWESHWGEPTIGFRRADDT